MTEPITFGEKPCRFYWWIGAPCCDNCGRPSAEHEGMAVLKPGSSPFGAANSEYQGYTWPEWREHADKSKQAHAARQTLANLSDDEAIAAAEAAS